MLVWRLSVIVLLFNLTNGIFVRNDLIGVDSFDNYVSEIYNEGVSKCRTQFDRYVSDLKEKKLWALKMYDAGAKLPSGILEGHQISLGDFDECMGIEEKIEESEIIYGKYCVAKLSTKVVVNQLPKSDSTDLESRHTDPNKFKHKWINFGQCIPNACSSDEIQEIYSSIVGTNLTVFNEKLCQSKSTEPELDGGSIATLALFGVFAALMVVSTAYDVAVYYAGRKPAHAILIAFSMFTNGKKIIATSNNPNQLNCLNGLKVLSMMWIVLFHTFTYSTRLPVEKSFLVNEWMQRSSSMVVLGSTVAVEVFFLISGMLIVYTFMGSVARGNKFNIFVYYLHRYLRITPVIAAVILFQVTIFKHLGSGPLWPAAVEDSVITPCKKYWWKTLLYIHNVGEAEDICIQQTWYLAADFQLYLLSPALLIPLKYWPKFTLWLIGLLTSASIIAGVAVIWAYELKLENLLQSLDFVYYLEYYYYPTWTRAFPWFMGLILGYYIFNIKQAKRKIVLNKIIVLLLWTAALATLFVCAFAGHGVFIGKYNKFESICYMAFVRPAWTLAIMWIVYACVIGYGGFVNWFLSTSCFQVLSKLTYSTYVVHVAVMYLIRAPDRASPKILQNSDSFYVYWGNLFLALVIGFIFSLAFELPFITIERFIFGEKKKPAVQKTAEVNNSKPSETA